MRRSDAFSCRMVIMATVVGPGRRERYTGVVNIVAYNGRFFKGRIDKHVQSCTIRRSYYLDSSGAF